MRIQNPHVPLNQVNIPYSEFISYPQTFSMRLDFSYLIVEKVIYMCICDSSYPRKLAFSYLDELSKEFQRSYEEKIDTVTRPYAFMGFGKFLTGHWSQAEIRRHVYLEDDPAVQRFEDVDARRRSSGGTE